MGINKENNVNLIRDDQKLEKAELFKYGGSIITWIISYTGDK